MAINDFGEKIGGARKDLASKKKFGITADDIKEWTDEERFQLVTKDLAFPKPNYKKLYDDGKGMDRNVLFYIKTVRDNLPTRPYIPCSARKDIDRIKAIQNDYLDTVNNLYKLVMNLKTLEDCYKFPAKILSDSFVDNGSIVKNRNFINKIRLDSDYSVAKFKSTLHKKQFLFSDDEKILTNYTILSTSNYKISLDTDKRLLLENGYSKRWINLAKPEFQDINKWKENTYFVVGKGHNVIAINLDSVEEAKKKILELNKTNTVEKEEPNQSRKHSLKPPQLESLRHMFTINCRLTRPTT